MPWVHGDWIDDDESLARPPSRWAFDPYIREVFESEGWTPLPPPASPAEGHARKYAEALLAEFGGLKLGESDGHGGGLKGYDIEFMSEPSPLPESEVQRWPFLSGSMEIASVDCDHARLVVDGKGDFFVRDDIVYWLRFMGNDFVAVVNTFIRGLPWPDPLPD